MEGETKGIATLDRAPSRAGHRPNRPPLKRSNACYNAFPDLPPIQGRVLPPLDTSSSTDSGSSSSDSEDDFKVDLNPLSPPSPPSPASPCSESSSDSLFSPLDQDEWERFHDGFAPPPLHKPPSSSWPSTPHPRPELLQGPPSFAHYGWSNNALHELKIGLWYRRQWAWWQYEEHCRYLASLSTDATDDGIVTTLFYPPPPALPPSRRMSWMSANGRPLPTSERLRAQVQPQANAAWKASRDYFKPIYPRFGDISDLHDSSCEEEDRRYYAVPSFKLRQFVFVNEMDALHGQPRKGANLAPPSPLARCWTPDSPASVYSQDSTTVVSSTTAMASTSYGYHGSDFSRAACPLMTEWRFRWRMVDHLFPPPPPPPLHAHAYLSHWFPPPPSPPQRPGTPLPGELPPNHHMDEDQLSVHANEGPAADMSIISLAPATLSDDSSNTEIFVHLPAPLPVQCPTGVPARPPTPFVQHGTSSRAEDGSLDSEPVVRLPSPSAARTTVSMVAPSVVSNSSQTTPLMLAHELERAAQEETSSVRFSVQPPPSRPESPRFRFITCDFEGTFGDEDAIEAS